MNPGRELDAAVAEKVMGFRRLAMFRADATRYDAWQRPHQVHEWLGMPELPSFSTDIALAWPIAEEHGFGVMPRGEFSGDGTGYWAGKISYSDDEPDEFVDKLVDGAFGETAAHAICLAALKAVGA